MTSSKQNDGHGVKAVDLIQSGNNTKDTFIASDEVRVVGAREHNLRDINVQFKRDQLVVITGLSGSGKSSLAFQTLYAEGQRRYMESFSAYARQFIGAMERPDVDVIEAGDLDRAKNCWTKPEVYRRHRNRGI
jgi:excinuclease ABC subunit A